LHWYWPIGVLEKGQDIDDADVAVRSLAWLEDQLCRSGVMEWGESLEVSSVGCSDNCLLDLVEVGGAEQNTILGFIELDAAGGFPGEVVRLDAQGKEVSRWRLRGDLTWEPRP
jgi:hypothetical protein